MSVVKKIIMVCCLTLAFVWGLGRTSCSLTSPETAAHGPNLRLARADLAVAVFTMVMERAAKAGLSQPVTLCEACTAANLGQPETEIRETCARACGLR
jgi:hypothetical protein